VLDTPPPHDRLPVQVELAKGASADDGTLARRLEAELKARLGATAPSPSAAGSLPRDRGQDAAS
jgi:phenylacetate-CoA ligase